MRSERGIGREPGNGICLAPQARTSVASGVRDEASGFPEIGGGRRRRQRVSAPAVWSPAKAQSRQETLLIVSESGPNNVDIHGVGTNVPGYEVSWNCYDRLISHEMKTRRTASSITTRDKFKMELAEDMNVGDMSATFKLRRTPSSRTARRSPPRT